MFAKAVRMLACVAAFGLLADGAQGQVINGDTDLESRIASLEARVAGLQEPFVIDASGPVYGGAYASITAAWLKPHLENPVAQVVAGNPLVLGPHNWEHEFSPRLEAGWEGEQGVGLRGRYWTFDHDAEPLVQPFVLGGTFPAAPLFNIPGLRNFLSLPGEVFASTHTLEMHVVDFELTRRYRLSVADVTMAGGVRYARIDQVSGLAATLGGAPSGSFVLAQEVEAAGPTLAINTLSQTRWDWLRLFADGRASTLFGQKDLVYARDVNAVPPPSNFITSNNLDAYLTTLELNLGVEVARGPLFGRFGWEGQLWLNSGDAGDVDHDLMLEGWHFSGGIRI